jgi:2-polyprenyl-6-methoxyphenol hydroxylase-like FAD-dependent oxidoreductase
MTANVKHVLLVGAGPAGAALAYLLARRGVGVTLLETHPNFERHFRGEGLQPSGVDAFAQMGLGKQLEQLPQARVDRLEIYRHGRFILRVRTRDLGMEEARMFSQPAILDMVTGEARRFPSFRLEMGVTVRELLREGGRGAGVRADTPGGPREYRADLVVGTDGRHAVTRKQGGFTELRELQGFDILWVKVPFPDCFAERQTMRVFLARGPTTFMSPASDGRLQVGFAIRKGEYAALRAKGADKWTEELIAGAPAEVAAHLRAHGGALGRAMLLDVVCGRLTHWSAPGLLLIGDAAHPMSPIGGQGINLALRDALVAANHLCPVLAGGGDDDAIDTAARRVEEERLPEIALMQDLQQRQARVFFEADRLTHRLFLRLLPLLAPTGLLPLLFRRRITRFAHGAVPVRLTA